MPDPTTISRLRGLVLSASEIKNLTNWPDVLIEGYLNNLENIVALANEIDTKNNILKTTNIIVTSPYTPLVTDEELFIDTNAIPISVTLPAGIDGTNYRMINIGSSGNDVTLIPNGTEKLFGEVVSEKITDSEVLLMTFQTNEGWY